MSDVPEIDIDVLAARLEAGAVLLDVREDDEYVAGHVAGARPIPLATVPERVAELDPAEPLLVICEMGGRSARAVQYLQGQGFDATNVAGGTRAWRDAGRPVVTGTDPV